MKAVSNMTRKVLSVGYLLLPVFALGELAAAQTCVQPPAGLASWWPGDGNANDIIGESNGTLVGGVTFARAEVGQGFSFDGNGYVSFGTGPAIAGTGPLTVDAWIRTTDDQGIIIQQRDAGAFNGEYVLSVGGIETAAGFAFDPGKVCWSTFGDGMFGFNFCSEAAVNDGLFHFIVATREADGSGRIYIDGVLDSSQSAPARTLVPLEVFMGADVRDLLLVGRGRFLAGIIDEMEIHTRALSQPEIQDIFFAGSAGKCKIEIDIKPGGFPNSINPRSKGVIPVAILTTDAFDATTVDPLSVTFGPNEAVESHGRGHLEDIDGDGDLDLVLHFRTQNTGIQCGDTSASLAGETFDGQPIRGSDAVSTAGCK
jgi:hypothetical protein